MILNINSPTYYTRKFGIDDELYSLSKQISNSVQKKQYSDVINTIGIVPIIAPQELLDEGMWKEKVHVSKPYQFADVQLCINYDEFINANNEVKRELYIKNILNSIRAVGKKLRKNFEAEEMINDILSAMESQN